MIERRPIEVVDILLDPNNFRHGPTGSQPETRAAIIKEQGRKLLVLATDVIAQGGFSPYDLPMVYPSGGRAGEYIMLEGNRRLLVLKALLDPELVRGTELYAGFVKLHDTHGSKLESTLFCAIVPNRRQALIWAGRKHQRGLGGAGTEDWNPVANDRFDAEMGLPTPNLDAMEFVRKNAELERDVADKIDASAFPITTLGRMLGDDAVKAKLGLEFVDGKLRATADRQWLTRVLGEIVTVIATSKLDGAKFNVRSIDDSDQRQAFADKMLERFPKPARNVASWTVDKSAGRKKADETKPAPKSNTKSTGDRDTVIPKSYRLKLPDGKVNDIFYDLRTISVQKHTNAVAIELRVFLELSVKKFWDDMRLQLPARADPESLRHKIDEIVKVVKKGALMKPDDLDSLTNELGKAKSVIQPRTLNMYVHNATYSAEPTELKVTWNRLAPFVSFLWGAQP